MSKPVVAIVGRPNVGKSTLFNVLAGEKIAIVKDTPGVTRDRIYADVTWLDKEFTLIDTGGIEPDSKDIILSQMREQAQIAIDTADVIIFITDVRQGLVDADSKVADMLRRSGKPVVLVVNKVDNFDKFMPDVYEFYNLGIGDPVPVSAASRLGLGDMLDIVSGYFPEGSAQEEEDDRPRIAIVGNRMWANPRSSTASWERTGSLSLMWQEQRETPLTRRSCTTGKNISSSILPGCGERIRSKKSWSGTALSVRSLL